MTQEQLLAKQRYETNLQQSVQSMLDETLGPKRAVARVSTKTVVFYCRVSARPAAATPRSPTRCA